MNLRRPRQQRDQRFDGPVDLTVVNGSGVYKSGA
jgi:hypothetical protein